MKRRIKLNYPIDLRNSPAVVKEQQKLYKVFLLYGTNRWSAIAEDQEIIHGVEDPQIEQKGAK